MSNTHRRHDRYHVECDPDARTLPFYDRSYRVIDTEWIDTPDEGIIRAGMTRTAALAAASTLNGRDMTPDMDAREGRTRCRATPPSNHNTGSGTTPSIVPTHSPST